jgi:hypothetical protein
MKKYAVHFKTYTKSLNFVRENEVVIVKVNTTTPFAGLLQRYINQELKHQGEKTLITSVIDLTTDTIYENTISELGKVLLFKTPLVIKFADPKKPEDLIIEPETI